MPSVTALSCSTSASTSLATQSAMVVLPVPGGPHSTIECGTPEASDTRSGESGAVSCGCPTTSSSDCGRMRSASGRCAKLNVAPSINWSSITLHGTAADSPGRSAETTTL